MIHLVTIREAESCQTAWGEIFEDAVLCEFAPATECWNYCVGEREWPFSLPKNGLSGYNV